MNIEYELRGDAWKVIPFGSYAVQLINTLIGAEDDDASPQWVKMAGAKNIEEAWKAVRPVIILAANLVAGKESVYMEWTGWLEKGAPNDVVPYFTGQDMILWEKWLSAPPVPALINEGRFGWQCSCKTALEAAVVEMVLGFLNGWRRKFRFCKKCLMLYHGKECLRCRPEAEAIKRFQGLLRQHKKRCIDDTKTRPMKNGRREELEVAAREIESLLKKLQGGTSLQTVLKKYQELCIQYGLPQRWVEEYKKRGLL